MGSPSPTVKDVLRNVREQVNDLLALFEAREQGQKEEYRASLQSLFRKVVEMKNNFAQMDLNVVEQQNESAFGPWPLPGSKNNDTGINWRIGWHWNIEIRPTTTKEDVENTIKRELQVKTSNGEDENNERYFIPEQVTEAAPPETLLPLGGFKPAKRIRQVADDE